MTILLASGSKTRANILKNAKISFQVVEHGVDEEEAKISYSNLTPQDMAIKLSEIKAIKPSLKFTDSFVIGGDQVLELNNIIGCFLILAGVILSQLAPIYKKNYK